MAEVQRVVSVDPFEWAEKQLEEWRRELDEREADEDGRQGTSLADLGEARGAH